jgi:hypothetical protein
MIVANSEAIFKDSIRKEGVSVVVNTAGASPL